jgi:hypothetical protein
MKVCANLPGSAELVYSDAVASSNFYYEVALAAISLLLLVVATPLLVYIEHLRGRLTQVRQDAVARQERFTQTEEDDAGGVGMLRAGVLEEIQAEGKGEVQEVVDSGGGKRKNEEDQGGRRHRGSAQHSGSSGSGARERRAQFTCRACVAQQYSVCTVIAVHQVNRVLSRGACQ